MSQTTQSYAVDKAGTGSSGLQALEKLPGSGNGCQGSKICSILQVSERCAVLQLLTRQGQVSQACRPWRNFQDQARASRIPSMPASYKCLKGVSNSAVLQLLIGQGQVA